MTLTAPKWGVLQLCHPRTQNLNHSFGSPSTVHVTPSTGTTATFPWEPLCGASVEPPIREARTANERKHCGPPAQNVGIKLASSPDYALVNNHL
jgi:hypothetical protein